ncbi:MAG: sugar phosphate isomerase/epimerase [Chthoniobacterales bacterium]
MKLKFACADFTFPLLPLDNALDVISLLEVDGVDIGVFEKRGSLWPSRELKNPERNGALLRKRLANRGLRPADIFLILGANSDFQCCAINHPQAKVRRHVRDQFLRFLDYVNAAGGKHLTGLPGALWKDEAASVSLSRSAEELRWMVEQARKAKLIFSVEAHLGSLIPRPSDAMKLLKKVPGLTLTLDYGHFIYQGISQTQMHPLIAHASHFHARGGAKNRLQTSVKNNRIDFATILKEMRRVGYTGWIGLEYVWMDWGGCNEVDNLSETLLLRDALRAIAKRLK